MSFGTILYTILISPLQLFFEFIFSFAERFTSNPGISIIVLSLAMNFLVLPLYKRADAMQAEERDTEAKLHDGIAHIKKVFSGDERMMMQQEYYRQNHYKPADAFKGSVSLFLEIPFFIAAYQFLSHLQILQGVSFGPIANLGAQDGMLAINGMHVNLLPILMTAINLVSCIIYTKGFPLKTKIQLYAMAVFFFFFLYDSPAGLLFYWTLNNAFSLIKNIFYKLKNPKLVLAWMSSLAGILLIVVAFMNESFSFTNKVVLSFFGVILQFPLLTSKFFKKIKVDDENNAVPNKGYFLLAALMLSVILGMLIPSSVISSSPQEFVDYYNFHNPLWYIASSFCLSFGMSFIWLGVFYWLSSKKGKIMFEKIMWIFCGICIMDYMFFGTDLGILSSSLVYEKDFKYTISQMLINIGLIAVLCIVMSVTFNRYKKFVTGALATGLIAMAGMSVFNMNSINSSVAFLKKQSEEANEKTPTVTLSKTEKNVVVIMLDRALGPYIPYLFNEKPELASKYDGFTYYSNTVSFGGFTNFGTPALFGGYEYTPVKMNARSNETLASKQNEALKVMPVLFDENGFDVTVFDPTYANYQWTPDLSIYNDYPNIKTYITNGKFNDYKSKENIYNSNKRNFYCYSIMKASPLCLQHFLYNQGEYMKPGKINVGGTVTSPQVADGTSVATGVNEGFMNSYNVLKNLPSITNISDKTNGSFLVMTNDLTHEPMIIQEPEYEPKESVNNVEFDKNNYDRFTVNGRVMNMTTNDDYIHYETNMAALMQIGNWLDYLRANGVYDNTRIILVSDHGRPLNQFDQLEYNASGDTAVDLEWFTPLLMVKDFNSTGFTTSDEFMTNGDVPTLATSNVIENATNPFTGNEITNTAKQGEQYVISSMDWDIAGNNGNVYLPADWYSVHDNIWDISNWQQVAEDSTSPTN